MRLIVIGAPGAGKGTQAKRLAARFGVAHVSTGDLLREHIEENDSIGKQVKELMDKGSLVPDETIIDLITEFVESGSFIFDGFPRTVAQAQTLDKMLGQLDMTLDRVIYVTISDDIVIGRMSGRQTCMGCGSIYNTESNQPKCEGICDICGSGLIVREDDSPPVVKRRLNNYYELTEPIIDYYRSRRLIYEISGTGHINEITDAIAAELTGAAGRQAREVSHDND